MEFSAIISPQRTCESKELLSLKEVIEKIGLQKAFGLESQGMKGIDESKQLEALEILSLVGHILSMIEKVPIIKVDDLGETRIDWISLKEANSNAQDLLSRDPEEYFLLSAEKRYPKEFLDSKFSIKIRPDIEEKIHKNIKGKKKIR